MSKPTAEELMKDNLLMKQKIRDVFGSGVGKHVLDYWKEEYLMQKLYHETDRSTAYAIGQRDFVFMINDVVNGE